MKLVFLGPPGAGKGTQASLLAKEMGIPHISTGDIFRQNMKDMTPLGVEAKSFIDKGLLVPDDVTNRMVKDRLSRDDAKKGFILDGYPRTIPQADFLDSISRLDKVINFELPDEEIIIRISGRRTCPVCKKAYHIKFNPPKKEGVCECGGKLVQRSDEMPETVKTRIEVYNRQTFPLIDHYRKKRLLVDVDAMPPIEDILKGLKKLLKK